jgi:hypothetical protein
MLNRKRAYLLRVAQSLAACQLLELQLKIYIAQALELVRKCVKDSLPFEMSGEDYQDASLGTLIKNFKKLCSNPALISALHTFERERNYVAHKAIADSIDPNGDLSEGGTNEDRLTTIEREANRLSDEIYNESSKFVGRLYFDDVSS